MTTTPMAQTGSKQPIVMSLDTAPLPETSIMSPKRNAAPLENTNNGIDT